MACLNPWDCESKKVFTTDGAMQTICAGGGGRTRHLNPRAVRVFALDGDKWKNFADIGKVRKGGCGFGVSEAEVSYTLNCTDRHIVGIIP